MTQQQKKFILAYQLLDSTVSLASYSWTALNETNRNLIQIWQPKYKCTCRIKSKAQIIFHYFGNRDRLKICLTLVQ